MLHFSPESIRLHPEKIFPDERDQLLALRKTCAKRVFVDCCADG
jgi:hypothetical protein